MQGVNVDLWSEKGFNLRAVGDVGADDLKEFRGKFEAVAWATQILSRINGASIIWSADDEFNRLGWGIKGGLARSRLVTAYGELFRDSRPSPQYGRRLGRDAMIAIVDDDNSVREAAKRLVRSLGYATATFASAEEFLVSGRLSDTVCLITDVQMPGMSGVDLQSHLTAHGHCPPVIFVTADPEASVRARALDAGAFGFLSKPFSAESLIACLDRALERYRSRSSE
jgi:CheY-like chemotaxis protein